MLITSLSFPVSLRKKQLRGFKTGASFGGGGSFMLYYTLVFLLVALVAGALGFWVVAGIASTIAKVLFVIFLVLFIASLFKRRA